MNTTFLLNNLEVGTDVRLYIQKKIATVDKLLSDAERADVEIEQDKRDFYRVEVMIYTPGGQYRAEETAQSIEAAIDAVVEMLKEQIRHTRQKRTTLTRRGERSIKKKTVIDESARF